MSPGAEEGLDLATAAMAGFCRAGGIPEPCGVDLDTEKAGTQVAEPWRVLGASGVVETRSQDGPVAYACGPRE